MSRFAGTIDKIHLVLQSGTTAADDCDSERALRATLSLQQLRELRSGASGHLHQTLIPDLVLYFSRYRHSRIWNLRRLKANARGNGSADRRVGVGTKITLQHGFDQSVSAKLVANRRTVSPDPFPLASG